MFKERFNYLVLLLLLLSVCIVYSPNILHPEKLLLAGSDGTKNYFTFLYHIVHDSTYWKFEGMHYPFGENIIFTDNQPIIANSIKLMNDYFEFSTGTLIAVHNLILFLGIVLGGFGIYLVLRKLKTGQWFALLSAIGLMLLQPQIFRLNSHYSMVYPVLPWIFYFWLHIWENEKPFRNTLLIGFLSTIFGLVHMYHFLTISVLCGIAILLLFLSQISLQNAKRNTLLFLLCIVLPYAILASVSNFIEAEPDRPYKVWGFFSYHSYWEGLFFSYKLPLFHFINNNIVKVRNIDPYEAINYIGIVSVLFTLGVIFKALINIKKLNVKLQNSLSTSGKLGWIFVISALISFGLPFTISGLEGLLEYSGPYQQFRSIGRVGWISFHAINFISIPFIYQWAIKRNSLIKNVLFSMVPIIIFWEAYNIRPIMNNPEHLNGAFCKNSDVATRVNVKEYQAILPDPYLHGGSEAFSWPHVGLNQDQALEIGYQLGLPSMATILSRTSLKQSALLNQLVCQPYEVPEIINLLKEKDNRPILVLESKLELYNYNSSLAHWTKGTEIVYENPELRLRKLPLDHFEEVVSKFLDSLAKNPVDTLFNLPLNFKHSKKEKTWGYEAILYCDSLTKGDAIFSFDIGITENKDVNAIIEVWQITKEHQNADHFSVRANYHYKKLSTKNMYIELPILIKPETDKIAIRIYKDNQKEKHTINFRHPRLFALKK